MTRCDTKSYWVAGIKVASGEASALTEHGMRRVVCVTPGPDEIHVRDLPSGTAIDIPSFGVLMFDQAASRGRANRRTDLVATHAALPRSLAERYVRLVAETRTDTKAVVFVLDNTDDPRLIRPLLARSRQSWNAVVNVALSADGEQVSWALQKNLDVLDDPELLMKIMSSTRWGLITPAAATLGRLGHSRLLCQRIQYLAEVGELSLDAISTMVGTLAEPGTMNSEHNVLAALLQHGYINHVMHKLAWPQPHYVGAIHQGDTGESIARTLLQTPLDHLEGDGRDKALAMAWKLMDSGVPSAQALLAHLGATGPRPENKTPTLKPRFVDSSEHRAAQRQEHELFKQAVASVAITGEFPESLGRNGWMHLGWSKGLPSELWSQAPFSEKVRRIIVQRLDDDELRSVLPNARGKTKAAVLKRLSDEQLWMEATQGHQRRACLEAMPVALLDQAFDAHPGDVLIREVAVERGALQPQVALLDPDPRVRAAAAGKTRDQALIAQALQDPSLGVVRVATRRCKDSAALAEAHAQLTAFHEAQVAKLVAERLAQVRWWEVAAQALARGEVVVARAALAELSHDDLLRDLVGSPALMPWAAQRLMAVQHVRSGR